jgi:hypothetical protein
MPEEIDRLRRDLRDLRADIQLLDKRLAVQSHVLTQVLDTVKELVSTQR